MLKQLRQLANRLRTQPVTTAVLDLYLSEAPSPAHAVAIFNGEWASRFPPPLQDLNAGQALLFDDARLAWGMKTLGGVKGKRVLELGPLEGGHSYMCDRAGAAEVVAIEANTRAYLKCLVVKELLGMPAVRFRCGDFVPYLRQTTERFDVCVASGVLYHMQSPMEVLAAIARVAPALYLWTHYYDEAVINATPRLAHRRVAPTTATVQGYSHQLHRHDYGHALSHQGFCGAGAMFSHWLTRDGILGALKYLGYAKVSIEYEQPNHVNGPAFAIAAQR